MLHLPYGGYVGRGRHERQPHTYNDAEIVAATLAGMPDSLGGKRMAIYIVELARGVMTLDWLPGVVPRCVPVEDDDIRVVEERHYRLVPARDLDREAIRTYR